MRNKVLMGVMLASSMLTFAQKDELKDAEKAFKKGEYSEAITALNSAEGSIASADEKLKSKYYYVKGQVYYNLAKNGDNTFENMDKAATAFDKLIALEEEIGKSKYSDEVKQLKSDGSNVLLNAANEEYKAKNYEAAYKGFEKVYRLSSKDTLMLFNAAVIALQGQDYDQSIKYYEELKDINFDGTETQYLATNKESGKQEAFGDKASRDISVKTGTYTDPEDKVLPSKRSEVIKNLALLYVQQGQNEKALETFAEAKEANPDDANLIISEANVYYQMGDKDKFKELMSDASKMAPDNADIQYNVGVVSMEQKDYEGARAAFRKAIEIKPEYTNAVLNLSTTYINEGNSLVEEMNALGNTKADVEKFNQLKEQKDSLFVKATEVLEKYIEKNGTDNKDVLTQLKNIYGALGDTENFQKVKGMLGE
ncbi:Tetratricopeptide repeat-containing protein [Pustulibacterium marinum]|uniref:Tetratricopeptide repeat-containing protein n=1 Tax=Pustulibacterium marinum TaxID=1224947 RepID=A0A1I7IZP9_9FLAO|nr:tetratricopeptide repeat protein [Pustulibacterium marinum]SFU78281.1 Tetratricopeptide repeat-containing protein [Pustulibacterium marinum]